MEVVQVGTVEGEVPVYFDKYAAAADQQSKRVYDHPWAESLADEYGTREALVADPESRFSRLLAAGLEGYIT